MIDGVRLAEGLWIIIALDIDHEGNKMMLVCEEGSSESPEKVGTLLNRPGSALLIQ